MIGATIAGVLLASAFLYCYKNAYKRPHKFPPGTDMNVNKTISEATGVSMTTIKHVLSQSRSKNTEEVIKSPSKRRRRNSKIEVDDFTEGPPRLPIYGSYWILLSQAYNNLSKAVDKLSCKYNTKVLGLYLGPFATVIVNDAELVKAMLNKEEFDGRVDFFLARVRSYWKKFGIFFTDGYFWHIQRRFTLRYMRDYGFGRRDDSLEYVISTDIHEMIDMAKNGPKYPAEEELVKGDLVQMPHFFAVPFINGVLNVFAKKTLPRSEYHQLWDLARGALLFQRSSDDVGRAITITPWLKDVLPNWSGYTGLVKGNNFLLNFYENLIKEVMFTHNESHDRHFLDMYIRKMKEEIRNGQRSTFSVDQLVLTCTDYTFPAASATEQVLSMLVERLLVQPEIQDKIHEEIDRVVGRHQLPTLDDRKNMPYTEACLRETMRLDTIVPLGVLHRCTEDTEFEGYTIPEDTVVAANFVSLHMDKKTWNDPEVFRPERFIVDGKLVAASDKSLPFGAGRRLCAGETFARQTMFQVFAGFMQAFKVSTPDGLPLTKPSGRQQGIITNIPDYWVRLTKRT